MKNLFQVEPDLRNVVIGDLFLLEECVDDSPPDYIPENGEEPPKKVFTRRKVFFDLREYRKFGVFLF